MVLNSKVNNLTRAGLFMMFNNGNSVEVVFSSGFDFFDCTVTGQYLDPNRK